VTQVVAQEHGLDKALDVSLIALADDALTAGTPVRIDLPVRNVNRTVGTMLGSRVTRRFGGAGLPTGPSTSRSPARRGSPWAPSSRAASPCGWSATPTTTSARACPAAACRCARARTPPSSPRTTSSPATRCCYGATAGSLFVRGRVGERFCVRNSGATAVVEGVGDHACEYMTGGRVAILGTTGRNVAAGMSGGVAYVLDLDVAKVNGEMVELEPLTEGDVETLREMLSDHLAETGSAVAELLLGDWPPAAARFTKVMPRDYKRVLEAMERARADGVDVDAAVMASVAPVPSSTTPHREEGLSHGRPHRLPAARSCAAAAAARRRPHPRLEGGLRGVPDRAPARAGLPVHGLRHPVLPQRLPAREPHPRVERPGVEGRLERGVERLHATNNFPEFTGRCARAVRGGVRARHQRRPGDHQAGRGRDRRPAWADGLVRPQPPMQRTGKRVAVVGSGPAGLAAAQQLTRAGHDVVVLERADRIGGLLRYGIPEFKMEKQVLDRRLEQLRAEGTEFRTGVDVGVDVTVQQLREEYDAVLLAGGSTLGGTCPSRAATSTASTWRWSTSSRRTACRRATCSAPRSTPPARTSSSSAAATPAPTASARRSGRAPAR
jgi:glutamate synthase (NADPH/NADH)